jgi:hypothetical protein
MFLLFRLEILLCLIGENFEESGNMVNGAVVSIRPKQDKICLWLRECGPYDVVAKVNFISSLVIYSK